MKIRVQLLPRKSREPAPLDDEGGSSATWRLLEVLEDEMDVAEAPCALYGDEASEQQILELEQFKRNFWSANHSRLVNAAVEDLAELTRLRQLKAELQELLSRSEHDDEIV